MDADENDFTNIWDDDDYDSDIEKNEQIRRLKKTIKHLDGNPTSPHNFYI